MSRNESTEEKIKAAARAMFMKKGYAATKTRDIAEHADINLALVNYYFRSKENLFKQIMMETIQSFFSKVLMVFNDTDTTLDEKLHALASEYIDMLSGQPEMPFFLLNELQSNPDGFVNKMASASKIKESVFVRQLIEELGADKIKKVNPAHFILNLMGLIVFPFIAKPMLSLALGVEKEAFSKLMMERKKLIPIWIMNMLK